MMPLIAQDRRTAAIDFSTIESLRDGRRIEMRAQADRPAQAGGSAAITEADKSAGR
jgi:hypothetical protein